MRIHHYKGCQELSSDRGSATITALIVVGVAAVLLSSLMWRQEIQVRVLENFRDHTQVVWLQRSAVDFARLILVEDQRLSDVDHLGEMWAIPLVDSKVADFLKNSDIPDEASQVVLMGSISDAQGLFNITNLWNKNFKSVNTSELEVFSRLLGALNLDTEIAHQTAQAFLVMGEGPMDIANVYALPMYQTPSMQALIPFITVLPSPTKVNVNTAPAEILVAVVPGLSRSSAASFVQLRSQKPLRSFNEIISLLSEAGSPSHVFPSGDAVDVKSQFWMVKTEITIKDSHFNNAVLIKRSTSHPSSQDATQIIWSRVSRS